MLERLVTFAERIPSWLRPAFFGAVALFAIVAFRMLFALPGIVQDPARITEFASVLLAATGAGAMGGFGYTLLGAPSRRIPVVGPYVAGVVSVGAYMLALLLVAPYISNEPLVEDRAGAIIFAVVTIFFGLLFGHAAFRD
jgi:hypothetical protein